ncbi:MAG: hypothetical protein KJ902_04290 [Candidatus Omnitrophica bacterium]|nr:hypothetical protein [Candidatus Omnitrophota bacterium]MBU4457945.1 hypothetical protein [Candidatus Omnitrophota bacterium]
MPLVQKISVNQRRYPRISASTILQRRYQRISASIVMVCITFIFISIGYAEEKNWSGAGDGSSWSDDDNWSPASAPTSADEALIDTDGASVVCTETFNAKSVTIGGNEAITLTSNNFIFGTISPGSGSLVAILNRSGGTYTLKGAGIVTVKGQYKDSEESLVAEPSFMFWIE